MNPVIHHCDNCGDEVPSYRPDTTCVSFTYVLNGRALNPFPPDAKVIGDRRDWPTRWGIGCSCHQRRQLNRISG